MSAISHARAYVVLSADGATLASYETKDAAVAEADRLAARGVQGVTVGRQDTRIVTVTLYAPVPADKAPQPAPVFLCSSCMFNNRIRKVAGVGSCLQYPGMPRDDARALCGGRARAHVDWSFARAAKCKALPFFAPKGITR